MMGLATTAISGSGNNTVITPAATGNIFVSITLTGQMATGTDSANLIITHGTGNGPAAGAAGSGTPVGSTATIGNTNAAGDIPYFTITLQGIILNATLGTQVWFDIEWINNTGARAVTAYDIAATAFEI